MNILLVDDERIIRESVANALSSEGYTVITAASARDAFEILSNGRIQLVVSDSRMPSISGLDLCRSIRNTDFGRYIYFVMLTGRNEPDDILEGLEAGADDYVTKPFHMRELVLRVNTGCRIIKNESRNLTILTLAKLAEFRDPDAGGHLERVRSYSRELALQLQRASSISHEVEDEFVQTIYETSPLHDIGKVAVPDSVLLKPGPLTDEEFTVMKKHTLYAADLLTEAIEEFPDTDYLRMARDIALTHHEHFDGSGYPRGLKGREIPLCGRIVAVADVYDALTSDRVYKRAIDHEAARDHIVARAGKQFDPIVVKAFVEIEQAIIEIQRRTTRSDQKTILSQSLDWLIPLTSKKLARARAST